MQNKSETSVNAAGVEQPKREASLAAPTGYAAGERQAPTIEELERILASGEPLDIEIQPDGSIRAVPKGTANNATPEVITLKKAMATSY